MLNRIYPSWFPSGTSVVDPDPRQQAEHARHLAKYVFPRQYGLSHAFAVSPGQRYSTFQNPDWMDREREIKVA